MGLLALLAFGMGYDILVLCGSWVSYKFQISNFLQGIDPYALRDFLLLRIIETDIPFPQRQVFGILVKVVRKGWGGGFLNTNLG